MAAAGLYRRVLPSPPAIEFASSEGKKLFSEALQNGTMQGFFKLISYFQTQSEPAYCGLATLSMVLNALAIDPGRKWKGPWRWFDESMLDCCEPLKKVKSEGITFGKVACLAHCAGAKVEAFRTNHSTIHEFREHVVRCASSEDCHLIASYHRKALKQTGTGHFSPIGGYHAGSDMALILDVARFKYPPHWVPVELLWEAMDAVDDATGYPRGFMLISRFLKAPALLYTLSCRHENWRETAAFLIDDIPVLLMSKEMRTMHDVLSAIFKSLPMKPEDFITWVAEVKRREEDGQTLSKEEKGRLAAKEEVLQQVRHTELFKVVTEWVSSKCSSCSSILASSDKDLLPGIAANVYCQVAGLLTGSGVNKEFCCQSVCINCLKCNGDKPLTVVSSMVMSDGKEQGVDIDMLIPTSLKEHPSLNGPNNGVVCNGSCPNMKVLVHPEVGDVITVMLLVLPPNIWLNVKEEKLRGEINCLIVSKSLPDILQEEVLHLRRQLYFLKKCKDNSVEDDLESLSSFSFSI